MPRMPPHLSPAAFLADVFASKAVRKGQVIRRKLSDIDRYYGREAFVAELRRRGFRAVENSGQLVIFCNRAPVRIVC